MNKPKEYDESTLIVEIEFGSALYGTKMPDSDTDIKFLFLPDPKDIVLQRAKKQCSSSTKKDDSAKSGPDDIEYEGFSLQEYLKHLVGGQTFALDMLFAPEVSILKKGPHFHIWEEIQANKEKLLSKKVNAFIGYCRAQASKYGVKGKRYAVVKEVVSILGFGLQTNDARTPFTKENAEAIVDACTIKGVPSEFCGLVSVHNPLTDHKETYFQVCGRKSQFGMPLIDVYKLYSRVLDEYGNRAFEAANNDGKDFKSLYHAVRVAFEAEEVLMTGHITLPRPEKELLLNIRRKVYSLDEISNVLDTKLADIELALTKTTLPDLPDMEWVDELVHKYYLGVIK